MKGLFRDEKHFARLVLMDLGFPAWEGTGWHRLSGRISNY
jgi:hypothetical protein